jgi:hypothetical protein
MPRVCKAVIKAKGGYLKNLKSKIYLDLINIFGGVTTWFHMCYFIVLMSSLLLYNVLVKNSQKKKENLEWVGLAQLLTGTQHARRSWHEGSLETFLFLFCANTVQMRASILQCAFSRLAFGHRNSPSRQILIKHSKNGYCAGAVRRSSIQLPSHCPHDVWEAVTVYITEAGRHPLFSTDECERKEQRRVGPHTDGWVTVAGPHRGQRERDAPTWSRGARHWLEMSNLVQTSPTLYIL